MKGVKEIVGVAHVMVQRWERWGCGGYINRPTLLNSAERVFAAVRRWVEGRRYERIEAKKAAGGCCEGWRLGERSHRW